MDELFGAQEAWTGDPVNPGLDAPTPREIIATLTQSQREQRVRALVEQAHWIYDEAIKTLGRGRKVAGTCIMWSGGNDSNTLAHVMRSKATHAAMADTTIGIDETRQFVRDQVTAWGLPLIEHVPPESYEELVLERNKDFPNGRGFPGPGMHYMMYQRLKERCFRMIPHDFGISGSSKDCVILLSGRRRAESERRKDVPEMESMGTLLWVTPLVMWTKLDIITYRRMHSDVPRNWVADAIHMSGECLCGAFAKHDELEEVGHWFPVTKQRIHDLEAKATAQGIPAPFNRWGHGSNGNSKGSPKGRSVTCGAACEPLKGQLDIFEALETSPPRPTFTVYAGRSEQCSWCGQKSYLTGGGVHHDNAGKSWAYAFCDACKQAHGWPQPGRPITYTEGG